MGRAMLQIAIVFAQMERESIQQRVTDAFYARCTKGYYMRGHAPFGFDTEPIVMDGIKTKRLVANKDMDTVELFYQMYAEPGTSYGDITRHSKENGILVQGKVLNRSSLAFMLRNTVYVVADMNIYDYYNAQNDVTIESPPELFTGEYGCYLYQGREGENKILVIAPHKGRIPSELWLAVQRRFESNKKFDQSGRKGHHTWLAGKMKCGCCGYALGSQLDIRSGRIYLRCKKRMDNKSCQGAGPLTSGLLEKHVLDEMNRKMQEFTMLAGSKPDHNPKLTTARAGLAKIEAEIENLLNTLTGANPTLLQYANSRIEELDARRQAQNELIADLTASTLPVDKIKSIAADLKAWESLEQQDKKRVVDALIHKVEATSKQAVIQWKI